MADNESYYRIRIEEELAAAERASDPSIAGIHREMARRYRDALDTPLRVASVRPEADAVIAGFNGA